MTFLKPVSAEKLLYIDLTKAKGAAFFFCVNDHLSGIVYYFAVSLWSLSRRSLGSLLVQVKKQRKGSP